MNRNSLIAATMRSIEHVTYASGDTRSFCSHCSWSVVTKYPSLNEQSFDKHVCKEPRNA